MPGRTSARVLPAKRRFNRAAAAQLVARRRRAVDLATFGGRLAPGAFHRLVTRRRLVPCKVVGSALAPGDCGLASAPEGGPASRGDRRVRVARSRSMTVARRIRRSSRSAWPSEAFRAVAADEPAQRALGDRGAGTMCTSWMQRGVSGGVSRRCLGKQLMAGRACGRLAARSPAGWCSPVAKVLKWWAIVTLGRCVDLPGDRRAGRDAHLPRTVRFLRHRTT